LQYSEEREEAALVKMMPPHNRTVADRVMCRYVPSPAARAPL